MARKEGEEGRRGWQARTGRLARKEGWRRIKEGWRGWLARKAGEEGWRGRLARKAGEGGEEGRKAGDCDGRLARRLARKAGDEGWRGRLARKAGEAGRLARQEGWRGRKAGDGRLATEGWRGRKARLAGWREDQQHASTARTGELSCFIFFYPVTKAL